MKIILVNKFHYLKGGSETYYFGLAEGLRAAGHEVHFFAMQGEGNVPCEDSDLFVSARDYNGPTSLGQKVSAAASLIYSKEAKKKFQALCERVCPDVVHMNLVHRQITLSILDAPYIKEHRVPVLFTAHDYILVCPNYLMLDGLGNVCEACLGGRFGNCLRRKCVKGSTAKSAMAVAEAEFLKASKAYRKIDRVICPSEFMRSILLKSGLPDGKVITMRNFIPNESLLFASSVSGKKGIEPYFVFSGRLSSEKGVKNLILAYAEALTRLPNLYDLIIAGDGPERGSLEGLVDCLNLGKKVHFLGHLCKKDLVVLLKSAAFCIVPSVWNEVLGYAALESMAVGTPVIASDIGGLSEVIDDGITGYLVEPGEQSSLATVLLAAFEMSDKRYSTMQSECIRLVDENFGRNNYIARLVSLYGQLIGERRES